MFFRLNFYLSIIFCFILTLFHADQFWMDEQIDRDLSFFLTGYCKKCLIQNFQKHKQNNGLCLIECSSKVIKFIRGEVIYPSHERFVVIETYFTKLLKEMNYPQVTILIALGDSWDESVNSPVWAMCKLKDDNKILFPDFEALNKRYNVIKNLDLENASFPLPYNKRHDRLIWRGAGVFRDIENNSRFKLCLLSQNNPELVDAAFSFCYPDCIKFLVKDPLKIEEFFSYKYQMWIDGNVASYSNSGWRFYTGSTVFKEDSDYIQWYFQDLKPWIHYVPVEKGLVDLIERIEEIQANPLLAEQIAQQGREFILNHVATKPIKDYLKKLIQKYSECPVYDGCIKCSN